MKICKEMPDRRFIIEISLLLVGKMALRRRRLSLEAYKRKLME